MPAIATVFRHPLGNGFLTKQYGDADGYNTSQGHSDYFAGHGYHLGEDWNGDGGGNTDEGDLVYSAANGRVVYAQNAGASWGNVVIVQHTMASGEIVSTLYGHLDTISVAVGQDLSIGQKVGEIGTANGVYLAHLHFALYLGSLTAPGAGYTSYVDPDRYYSGYVDPTWFINNHRQTDTDGSSFASATSMSVGSTKTGSVGVATDEADYFKFVAAASGEVALTLSGLSSDIDLFAYNGSQVAIDSSTASGTANELVSFQVVAGQTYYVLVSPYQTAESNYALRSYFYPTYLSGSSAGEAISGNHLNNTISGYGGNDTLKGLGGNDRLVGGTGADSLYGGSGVDYFDFNSTSEIGRLSGARDIVRDFSSADDYIDLRSIDANTSTLTDNAFVFRTTASASFSGTKGELRWYQQNMTGTASDRTFLIGDVNGDRIADFRLEIVGLHTLRDIDILN